VASINLTKQQQAGDVAVKRIREMNANFAVENSVIYPSVKSRNGLELGEINNGCYKKRL
jgi:flagellar biosynthesis component FlhA